MRNVNAVTFTVRNQRNEKQFKIPFVHRNHSIHLKTIASDFAVFFADRLFIESEDEEHSLSWETEDGRWKISVFRFQFI